MPERRVVHKIEEGMDRQEVEATTYQQRNFYVQMRDGFFSRNETFNYMLHHQVAKWAPKGARVLDVCCGRGLMLPLLRYHADLTSYTGLDIKRSNAVWREKRVTDGKPLTEVADGVDDYYPFTTYFVEGNVAQADELCRAQGAPTEFDFIIYTASIEHMHPEAGQASLRALRALASDTSAMVLTCPNTPEDQDGYDTRYKAHVYEWKLSELLPELAAAGWQVQDEWTVDARPQDVERVFREHQGRTYDRIRAHVPQEWCIPALAPQVPVELAAEVGFWCVPDNQRSLFA
jgi:SAM-dependent methyltransferase